MDSSSSIASEVDEVRVNFFIVIVSEFHAVLSQVGDSSGGMLMSLSGQLGLLTRLPRKLCVVYCTLDTIMS